MLKYIEFCAGGGGMRAGLDAAGWQCVLAVDNDPDAVAVHRLAHGDAHQADVTQLSNDDLPESDAWVAGFPCQPFSSSGNRLGFGHRSGNVFEHLARLMAERRPRLVILENVEGLLTNKSGHTLAVILSKLTNLGYSVSWLLLDLQWFDVPQTRARLFLVATQPSVIRLPHLVQTDGLLPGMETPKANVFAELLTQKNVSWIERCHGSLNTVEASLRPAVGKARPSGKYIFGPLGNSEQDTFCSYDVSRKKPKLRASTLGKLVAPNFKNEALIRSIRFWTTDSGRGPTKLWIRPEPVSHCIGTSLGGAPLYAVPLPLVKKAADRDAFLEFANWHREQDSLLVMRLRPNRAVMLFGPHTEALHKAVTDWDAGDTRKYKVVGNMVAPVCAKAVAELINQQWVAAAPASTRAANGKRTGRKTSSSHAAKP
jgi:DNA-cytosine methyltransferase